MNRVWLMRAMCHVNQCRCADRGGIADDYDACRLVSRHANAIMDTGGSNIKEFFDWLGCRAKDKITGFKGTVDSICFDLYGCVMASLVPDHESGKEKQSGSWFDVKRLEKLSTTPVMEVPTFTVYGAESGPADKSPPR